MKLGGRQMTDRAWKSACWMGTLGRWAVSIADGWPWPTGPQGCLELDVRVIAILLLWISADQDQVGFTDVQV